MRDSIYCPMCYKLYGLWHTSYIEDGNFHSLTPVDDLLPKYWYDNLQAKGDPRVEDDMELNPEDDINHYWVINPKLSPTPERVALVDHINKIYSRLPKLHANKVAVRLRNEEYLANQLNS